MSFLRYVAIGDSQTEGLNDHDGNGGFRGWADRLAGHMAAINPDVLYANLAVRGKTAVQIHEEQLEPALALKPDLLTVVGGMNDVLRSGFELDRVVGHLEAMYAAGVEAGVHVATCTYPDIGRIAPLLAGRYMPRLHALNAAIRDAARRYGLTLVEADDTTTDPRLWSEDRIHASPLGHSFIAAAFAEALGVPGVDVSWREPLPPLRARTRRRVVLTEVTWLGRYVVPRMVRHARGRSSGDGVTAKRPELLPVTVLGVSP